MMSKGKELWRAIKLFLLYSIIETVITGFAGIPIVFHGLMMHMSREAIEERVLQSNYYKLSECIAYLLIIIVFINNRYVVGAHGAHSSHETHNPMDVDWHSSHD